MIKVLYLRSSFDPGGTETLLLNLFNYPQSQIEFHYAFLKNGSLISKLLANKNKYYKIFRKRKIDFYVLNKLLKIIKTENIRLVHTHQMFELCYAVLLKLINPELKLFHTVHGYHDEHSKWAEYLERFLIRFTQKTFTVSHSTKSILKKRGYPVRKIQVIYNAVIAPKPAEDFKLERFKQWIHYKKVDFIIGMIGAFVWQKDQLTIIKAFNLLKDIIPALKVVLIGKESDLSEKCKALVAKADMRHRVFFLGALENASQYLPLFDVFIMSTLMDTFGIVVIEALLNKIPVVASDIDVMKELSNHGEYIELFQSQNHIDLAEKIKNHYNARVEFKIEKTFLYAKNRFDYNIYIHSLSNYYLKY